MMRVIVKISTSSNSRNTVREEGRLRLSEDGWDLIAGTAGTSYQTQNAGAGGRPKNPNVRRSYFNEASSTDSDYEAEDEDDSSLEEEEEYDDSSSSVELVDPEDDKKPPPTQLVLELESLKQCMEKNCRCPAKLQWSS
jgi:hypothetical protein